MRECIISGTKGELHSKRHAETYAIANAYQKEHSDLLNKIIYIIEKFPNGKKLIKEEPKFYCTLCAVTISKSEIKKILSLPSKEKLH
ncbi:hypothetical protein GW931_01745 [archaeon]|nr:hypothetical protein [archaeon]